MFEYNENSTHIEAENAIKEYLMHIKKVKANKEVENPRYFQKAEEELKKAVSNRQHRRLAIKALKKNPDDVLEFLKDSTLKI